ncbi:MAG: class I SAM-dependent methyltransferase [Vicinamibacterales bacterium]
MTDRFEIIVIGYRSFWRRLERAIHALVRTNTSGLRIHVGLNSPEPEMVAMIERYRAHLASVTISAVNLNKVGMQRELVQRCTATYVISFDDDSFPIHDGWQAQLQQRVLAYETRALPPFGDFGPEKEARFAAMTGNTVGLLGLIFYEWLDQPKQDILARCPWYDPATKLNHEGWNDGHQKLQVWFCAGAFYVFLREPYVRFDYPGFAYRMKYEDVILSYFFQHHGYRLGDLVGAFEESGLDSRRRYAALGTRVIVNAGQRTWDFNAVEEQEHSLAVDPLPDSDRNEYLMDIISYLKTLPHVEADADYLNAPDYYPYLNALARDFKAERVLEVGVRFGYSAVAFIHGNSVREYVGLDYDLYDPTSSTRSRENLDALRQQQHVDVTLLKVDTQSLDSLDLLGGRRFDFIHIDGDHSYEGALTDLRNFWNVLSVGGHMLVDDSIFYGAVRQACVDFAQEVNEPHFDVKTYRGTWVFLKTRERTFPVRRSSVNEQTPVRAITDADVAFRFHAQHAGWSGPLLLLHDGTFRGGMNSPDGTWTLAGDQLTLRWYHWPADHLRRADDGEGFVPVDGGSLRLRPGTTDAHLGGNIPGGDPQTFYPELWSWLVERLGVTSVLDVGCGEGHALAEFAQLGARVFGIDGYAPNIEVLRAAGVPHLQHDFTAGPPPLRQAFDLCWCCEFVEHVEARYLEHILAAFKACRYVAMTHALPGQGGHHHVNCQADDYWVEHLEAAGFRLLPAETMMSRERFPHSYWGRSGLIFVRQ